MTVEEGMFSKTIGTTTNLKSGLKVATGNEINVLNASITATAATANQATWVVPNTGNYRLTRMAIRQTTAVVAADTTTGVVKVSYALTGTATLADSLLTANFTTAAMTSGATVTTDVILAAPLTLAPGTLVALRNVQGTGGSVAGVVSVSVYATEVDTNTNT